MIDVVFLERFSVGVAISILGLLLVESIIRLTQIRCSSQKSRLYMVVLISCFFSILYAPFLFNVQARGDRLLLYVPNVLRELEITLKAGSSHWFGDTAILDFRFLMTVLLMVSLLFLVTTLFLSKYYIKRQFSAETCVNARLTHILETVCCSMNMKIPEVFLVEGVNAFVVGVPAGLAVGKDLLRNTSDQELALILRHEMNHIKNHDNILKPLLVSLRIFLFMNPVIHILSRKITREREFLADRVSEIKKEKVLFLYAVVRLGELHIEKKRSILSITSTPLIKSDFASRTDVLLSESRKSNMWLYLVSFWILVFLLITGAYGAGDFMHVGGTPRDDVALNHLDIGAELAPRMEHMYSHTGGNPGPAAVPGMEEVPPLPRPFFINDPSHILEKMGSHFYDIGVEAVIAAVFVISLSGGAVQCVRNRLFVKE
ncbi:MAG: M48 family metalloprotease [Theionarchaea archaeon]|nr:M48 family metalloprotease [Theionarchaea archaeon]